MYFEDITLGMTREIPPVRIDKQRMLYFAKIYDPLPLHLDEEYAKKTRFGDLIAPGVMTFMSVWARFIEEGFFGEELIAGKSTKIEWHLPVYAEDVLHSTIRVSALTPRNAHNGIVETTLEAYNQHGKLVLTDVTETIVSTHQRL